MPHNLVYTYFSFYCFWRNSAHKSTLKSVPGPNQYWAMKVKIKFLDWNRSMLTVAAYVWYTCTRTHREGRIAYTTCFALSSSFLLASQIWTASVTEKQIIEIPLLVIMRRNTELSYITKVHTDITNRFKIVSEVQIK